MSILRGSKVICGRQEVQREGRLCQGVQYIRYCEGVKRNMCAMVHVYNNFKGTCNKIYTCKSYKFRRMQLPLYRMTRIWHPRIR